MIVGGGPAGITAAIRCMNHHLSILLVEGRKLGGQLIQLYPTKFIYDYSSYPEIRAGYLADRMRARRTGSRRHMGGGGIEIDKEKCVSCGACMSICPNVFQRDGSGKSEVKEDADVMLPCVDTAIEACPTQAISLN